MIKHETFPKAPIREAILDIQVSFPENTDLSVFSAFQKKIENEFPEKQEKFSWQTEMQINKDNPPLVSSSKGGILGYLFKSPKKKKIVQARLDGFTFNKLKPYENWVKLRDESRILWNEYVSIAKPEKVTRLALRYINSIEVPLNSSDLVLEEYLKMYPEVPNNWPYKIGNFFSRLEFKEYNKEIHAIVNISKESAKNDPLVLPIIFDIDVFKIVDLHPEENDSEIWEIIESLRDFKNEIFFENTTDKAKELFR